MSPAPEPSPRPYVVPAGVRAVLLDLDDTLVDHSGAAAAAVAACSAEHGRSPEGAVDRWTRITTPLYAAYQRRELTHDEQRRERVRAFLGVDATDAEADELFAGYLRRYEAGWRAFPDTVPALQRLRAAGLALAVLTNGDDAQQRRKLDRTGLSDAVDLVVASSTLPAAKPDPRAFLSVVTALGGPAAPPEPPRIPSLDDVRAGRRGPGRTPACTGW